MDSKIFKKLALLTCLGLAIGLVAVPATGKAKFKQVSGRVLAHLSGAPATRYYLSHPELAPPHLRAASQIIQKYLKSGYKRGPITGPPSGDRWNNDTLGLPQNEESASVCRLKVTRIIGGANDYRSDSEGNITGWYWTSAGEGTLTNEGLLPHIVLSDGTTTRPSGGDPANECRRVNNVDTLYAASLNYDPVDPFGLTSAIGVYKTDHTTLDTCPGGSDPSCWPTSRAVAESAPNHFLDKEWMDIGDTGDGQHVWVTWTDFDNSLPCCYADIMAARCEIDLSACSTPIKIDTPADDDVQFSDVTVGDDGRTYITYAQIIGEIEGSAQTFVVKLRIGDPSCSDISCFGPVQTVYSIGLAIPFGGFMQADDFRVASVPKNTVKLLSNGTPRIFVVWDQCKARPFDTICEESRVQMSYSDDDGATWSDVQVLSKTAVHRVDYFPTIDNDKDNGNVVVAWYTNRLDTYQNAQNIEVVTVTASTSTISKRQIITTSDLMPNEPEADPLLGGFFIGDYIEITAAKGTAYVAYNMNIRPIALLGIGQAVYQQDNYLTTVTE